MVLMALSIIWSYVLSAFCTLAPEAALEAAHRAEQAVARGEALGPLHGIPVSVKDLAAAGRKT